MAIILAGCAMYSMVLIRRNLFKIKAMESVVANQLTSEDVNEILQKKLEKEKSKKKS